MQAVPPGVGEDHVGVAVLVDIDQPQSRVAAGLIDDRRARRQRQRQPRPAAADPPTSWNTPFCCGLPTINSQTPSRSRSQKPDALIAAGRGRSTPGRSSSRPFSPSAAAVQPRPSKCHRPGRVVSLRTRMLALAVLLQHAEAHARQRALALGIGADDRHGEIARPSRFASAGDQSRVWRTWSLPMTTSM